MRKSVKLNFDKGMNKDLDKSLVQPGAYLHAENFRIFADKENNTLALENVIGNRELVLDITIAGSIIGYCKVSEYVILFTTLETSATPSITECNDSYIYRFRIDTTGNLYDGTLIYSDNDVTNTNRKLAFSTYNKISAVPRIESEDVKKVYFVDGYNPIRFINVQSSTTASLGVHEIEISKYSSAIAPELNKIVTGNLKSGVVFYAYRAFDTYGAQAVLSPISNGYHVVKSKESVGNESDYKGSLVEDTDTDKGFVIRIDNSRLNSLYGCDYVELIALHYSTLNNTPTIRIVEKYKKNRHSTESIYITDIGQSQGTYTLDELLVNNRGSFIAEILESKNNYLIASNTKEDVFDVEYDARAYRYNSDTNAYIYQDPLNRIKINSSGQSIVQHRDYEGAAWINKTFNSTIVVPEEYNAINYYNNYLDESYNSTSDAFQVSNKIKTLTQLGGSGINVDYTFSCTPFVLDGTIDSSSIDSGSDGKSFASYASPFNDADNKSLARNEVYRVGLVLYDKYGRSSFVKWIGDIRTPDVYDTQTVTTYVINNTHYYDFNTSVCANNVLYGIRLNLNVFPSNLPSSVVSYKVVYVKRQQSDKSVIAQGLLNRTVSGKCNDGRVSFRPTVRWYSSYKYADKNFTYPYSLDGYTRSDYILTLDSPEVTFNNAVDYKEGDYIKYVKFLAAGVSTQYSAFDIAIPADETQTTNYTGFNKMFLTENGIAGSGENTNKKLVSKIYNDVSINSLNTLRSALSDAKIVNSAKRTESKYVTVTYENKQDVFKNYAIESFGADTSSCGPGGKTLLVRSRTDWPTLYGNIIDTQSALDFTLNAGMIVNYKRNVFDEQYGGYTYNARQNNKYISLSKNVRANFAYAITSGDMYISVYDHVKTMLEDISAGNDNWMVFQAGYFPVETSINLSLRTDDSYNRVSGIIGSYAIKEYAGKHLFGKDKTLDSAYYTQTTDLYQYNSVYSKVNDVEEYFTKPTEYISASKNNYKIVASDKKTNLNLIDNWTIFKYSNQIEVDSKYGGITALKEFRDTLYFTQKDAVGIVSVNPRSLISDDSGLQLALGTGGVLDRYDYITTACGNQNKRGLVASDDVLYFIDNKLKNLFYVRDNRVDSLSKEKMINSYFGSLGNITSAIGMYDKIHNELLFNTYSARQITCESSIASNTIHGNSTEQLVSFSIAGVNSNNSDNGKLYYSLVTVHGSDGFYTVTIKLYKDSSKLSVVATSSLRLPNNVSPTGAQFTISSDYGMSGNIIVNVKQTSDISINNYLQITYLNTLLIGLNTLVAGDYVEINGISYRVEAKEYTQPATHIQVNSLYNMSTQGELYMTNEIPNDTLVFSEYTQSFTGIYTCKPIIYINIGNFYYTSINNNNLFVHGQGEYGTFYNTLYPSTIKAIVNADYFYDKIFDNIFITSNSYNNGVYNFSDTFNQVRMYNDYQNSDYITLNYGDNVIRKTRTFSVQVPRNSVNKNIDQNVNIFDATNLTENKRFGERIRDKYMIIDMVYNNTNNYNFSVPYITVDYRPYTR